MATAQQFDTQRFDNIAFPYDLQTKELDDSPRLVAGENIYVDLGGRITKRPAVVEDVFAAFTFPANERLDRMWLMETVENPSKIYILGSFFNSVSSNWIMRYIRVDAGPGSWTSIGTLRQVDNSTRAHEATIINGRAYIKGFPSGASGEKLGSVIFFEDATLKPWGYLGPSVAANVTASGGWSASTNPTTITFGWKYAYSYRTSTDHITNRSPLATPTGVGSLSASDTGPFTDLQPEIEVQGHADTTHLTDIVIWRTTDGGGTFYYLDEITNTGAGTITYTDENRSGVPGDPKTDFQLDTSNIAPSLVSNFPPPPVGRSLVIGTDTPVPSSPIVEYAGRSWFAIGNELYFSGAEEILNGVIQESFFNPQGVLKTNRIIFKNQVRNLVSTTESLYVLTSSNILRIRGFDRSTFRVLPVLSDVGAPTGHPRSAIAVRDLVVFLTHDLQLAFLQETNFQIFSIPLKNDIKSRLNSNTEIILGTHSDEGDFWVLVGLVDTSDSTNSRIWIYDVNRRFWSPPWTIPVTSIVSGPVQESSAERKCVIGIKNADGGNVGVLDKESVQDELPGGAENIACSLTTNLFQIPVGNHVHILKRAGHHPTLAHLQTERTKFASDTEPTVSYRLDNFTGSFTSVIRQDPPYISPPTSHVVSWYPIQKNAQRAQLKIEKAAANESFAVQTLGFVWQPNAPGAA